MIGAADSAPVKLAYPMAVACTPDGSIFIADSKLFSILKYNTNGTFEVVARAGPKNRTPLRAIRALAAGPAGELLAADSATFEVYRIQAGQAPVPLSKGAFDMPTGIAVAKDGSIVVCDLKLGSVMRVPKDGGAAEEIARVPAPRGVVIAPNDDIIVLSAGPNQLLRVTAKGEATPIVKGKPFRFPMALALDATGTGFVVSDTYAVTVWSVDAKGEVKPLVKGDPLKRPEGLARDASGSLLVADPAAVQIFRVGDDGKVESMLKGS
jgi:glucose/arabinose dehydrogenase